MQRFHVQHEGELTSPVSKDRLGQAHLMPNLERRKTTQRTGAREDDSEPESQKSLRCEHETHDGFEVGGDANESGSGDAGVS